MLLSLIRVSRPINLLIITLTFYVLFQLDISTRQFISKSFYFQLENLRFLVISTLLIAAAGYFINDYYDKELDAINRPEKNKNISKTTLLLGFLILSMTGLILSFIFSPSIKFFLLFPFTIFILWIYSYKLKSIPFLGNLSIAVLSALIPFLYLGSMQEVHTGCQTLFIITHSVKLTIILGILAFLSTLAREIIKDIEDIEGDKHQGVQTIPIAFGRKFAKLFALLFSLLTLIVLTFLVRSFNEFNFQTNSLLTLFLLSFIPLLLSVVITFTGKNKKQFKQAGNLIKIGMFGFLVFLYLYAITL